MKEIKFRAWDKTEKKILMSQDEYTCGLVVLLGGFTKYGGCVDYSSEPCFEDFQWYNKKVVEERYILMQYTSLKDKNWWEDDILESPTGKRGVIKYSTQFAEWDVADKDGVRYISLSGAATDNWKKVGDIHTNPELMEKK